MSGMPNPFPSPFPRDVPRPRSWTVTVRHDGTLSEQVVEEALEPTSEGGQLVFRDGEGRVVATFVETEVTTWG